MSEDEENDSTFIANMAKIEEIQPQNVSVPIEKLQTRFQYWSSTDPKQMKNDKTCIVCHKRNMNWQRYCDHLEIVHSIYQMEDDPGFMKLSDVISARDSWF